MAVGSSRRILIINWRDIRHPEAGGAEVFVHEIGRRWAASGCDVSLLTSGFAGGRRHETIDGVEIERIGRLRNGSFHLLAQRRLASAAMVSDVLVESINTVPYLTPLWRRRLPPTVSLIYQLARDVWDAELPPALASLARRAEGGLLALYRGAPVATISESTRIDLVNLGFRSVTVVSPGCDPPPPVPRAKADVPTLLYVGRLASNKRPEHAVEAFRRVRVRFPDAQLWIVGQGRLSDELQRDLPAGAELFGRVSRDELYSRMAAAHCLLVPSVREGWGLVVIEANSVGTPAVGYDIPGLRDSIRHGDTGFCAAPGDPGSLAEQACRVLSLPPEDYARLASRAAEWAASFSWDAAARDLLHAAR